MNPLNSYRKYVALLLVWGILLPSDLHALTPTQLAVVSAEKNFMTKEALLFSATFARNALIHVQSIALMFQMISAETRTPPKEWYFSKPSVTFPSGLRPSKKQLTLSPQDRENYHRMGVTSVSLSEVTSKSGSSTLHVLKRNNSVIGFEWILSDQERISLTPQGVYLISEQNGKTFLPPSQEKYEMSAWWAENSGAKQTLPFPYPTAVGDLSKRHDELLNTLFNFRAVREVAFASNDAQWKKVKGNYLFYADGVAHGYDEPNFTATYEGFYPDPSLPESLTNAWETLVYAVFNTHSSNPAISRLKEELKTVLAARNNFEIVIKVVPQQPHFVAIHHKDGKMVISLNAHSDTQDRSEEFLRRMLMTALLMPRLNHPWLYPSSHSPAPMAIFISGLSYATELTPTKLDRLAEYLFQNQPPKVLVEMIEDSPLVEMLPEINFEVTRIEDQRSLLETIQQQIYPLQIVNKVQITVDVLDQMIQLMNKGSMQGRETSFFLGRKDLSNPYVPESGVVRFDAITDQSVGEHAQTKNLIRSGGLYAQMGHSHPFGSHENARPMSLDDRVLIGSYSAAKWGAVGLIIAGGSHRVGWRMVSYNSPNSVPGMLVDELDQSAIPVEVIDSSGRPLSPQQWPMGYQGSLPVSNADAKSFEDVYRLREFISHGLNDLRAFDRALTPERMKRLERLWQTSRFASISFLALLFMVPISTLLGGHVDAATLSVQPIHSREWFSYLTANVTSLFSISIAVMVYLLLTGAQFLPKLLNYISIRPSLSPKKLAQFATAV